MATRAQKSVLALMPVEAYEAEAIERSFEASYVRAVFLKAMHLSC